MTELNWCKSTYSDSLGGSCVEVAETSTREIAVRDSKNRGGSVLRFADRRWGGVRRRR